MWSLDGRVNPRAARLVDAAARSGQLLLSPISAWEIGMLVARGRIKFTRPAADYVRDLFTQAGVVIATITAGIALEAATLSQTLCGDPADRIIIATAIAYGAQLVTRDRAIQEYAKSSKRLRYIAC